LNTPSAPALHDLAYTASLRRTHHTHRLALVGATFQELTEQLDAFLQDEVRPGLTFGEAGAGPQQRLVFVFPGQGAQWFGMGRQLLAQEPVFRDALQACAAAFKPYVDWSVIEQLTAPSDANRLDEIDVLQPTLFAIQVALVALWRSWGVIPSAVIGHSMGEVAAAHVAGILSLPDAARIICRRSQLLRRIRGQGAMLIAEISLGQAETLLMPYADQVSIAVSNSTRSTVLAGDPTVLESLRTQLEAQSIFCRWVKVDVAAHSPQVDPLRTDLQTALEGLAPQAAALPLYSTVTSQVCTGTELGSAYWVRNLREPVLFGPTVQHLIDDGHDRFVEISPHPLLLSAIAEGLQEREQTGQVLASLQRETDERLALLGSLGALYTTGYPVDWSSLYPAGGACVTLPSYPWQRQRFWIEPPSPGVAALPSWRALAGPGAHPLLGMPIELATAPEVHAWSGILTLSHLPYLSDHQVQDTVVLPASAYVEMVLAAAQSVFGSGAHELTHLVLHQMLVLIEDQPLATQVVLTAEGADRANVQVFSRRQDAPSEAAWNLHASVSVRRAAAAAAPAPAPNSMLDIQARCSERIAGEAHYRAMTARGLHYGPCFRGINQIWRRVGEALAQVSLPDTIDPEPSYQIHPALLDACLQTFTTAQFGTGDQDGESTPSIPVGFRSIQMFQRPAHEPVWVHIRLQSDPATSEAEPCGDMDVFDASGQLLLTLRGLQMRRLEPVEHATRADRLSSSLYALQWQAQPLLPPASQPTTAPATWLILGDRQGVGQRLQALLAAQGHHAVLVIPNTATSVPAGAHTLDPSDSAAYTKLLQTVLAANHPPCKGVVHLWSLDTPDDIDPTMVDPALGWGSIVPLVQALIHTGTRARLWFVTRGAQPVGESAARIALGQVPQWGLGLTIAQEHPELRCSRIDLHAEPMANEATMLLSEFAAREFEDQVALRPDARHVARLVAWVPTAEPQRKVRAGDQPFRLEIATPGRLDKLALRATTRQAPGPGEVEIQVEAAGLNFKDVLLALGAISDGAAEGSPRLGQECAGRIMAVGPGVTAFEVGQEVVALASMSFSTFVIADQRLVAPKPAHLTFAEAATIPVAFLTAYYALHHVARLMPGERILIHAATGGVGLAAIQLAQRCGAEIFATAGSPEKRAFLKALGVAHVMDSRSLAFVDQVRELTAGAGVDVVLNSLGGEFIAASFGVLADYGRFVELGRRDYDQDRKLGLKPFLKNLSFSLLDLRGMMDQRPQVISAALQEVMALVTTRALTPTVRQVVPVERIDEAFHTMAQARHIGKIAVSFAERSRTQIQVGMPTQVVRPDGTYVITGGLGGIGLTVARWLVAQGAQHLVLIGRRAPDRAAAQVVADLQEHGTTVVARQADVTDRAALAAVFTSMADMPPIRGVIHAAAVLNDATVLKLDAPGFAQVLAPKVHGAWNLHQLTRDLPLDFFVLFSSVASLIGSSGQGNYAAANAFLDMLAHYRQAQGLPALSINWGAWAEVGLAAERSNRGERLMQQGIASFTPEEGVELLGRLLRYAPVQVGAVLLNLRQWLQAYPGAAALPLFIQLRQTDTAEDVPQSGQHAMRTALEAAEPTQRRALLETHLREQIAQVLRLSPSQIGVRTPLGTIGFDSLLALELRNRLEASLGLALSGTLIWGYPTIQALVPYLAEKMDIPLEPAKSAAPPPKEPEPAPQADHVLDFLLDQGVLDELEQLSDEEVRRMLST
jgi:acyl transferase domain-containing protein/acyl carrier protein